MSKMLLLFAKKLVKLKIVWLALIVRINLFRDGESTVQDCVGLLHVSYSHNVYKIFVLLWSNSYFGVTF